MIYGNRLFNWYNLGLLLLLLSGFDGLFPLYSHTFLYRLYLWVVPVILAIILFSFQSKYVKITEYELMINNYLLPFQPIVYELADVRRVTVKRIPNGRGGHNYFILVITPDDETEYQSHIFTDEICHQLVDDLTGLGIWAEYEDGLL